MATRLPRVAGRWTPFTADRAKVGSRIRRSTLLALLPWYFIATAATAQSPTPIDSSNPLYEASPVWAESLSEREGIPAFFAESWLRSQWDLVRVEGEARELRREVRQAIDLLNGYRLSRLTRPNLLTSDGCFEPLPWDHLAERNRPSDWQERWGTLSIDDLIQSAPRAVHARIVEAEQGYYAGALGTLYKMEPLEWLGKNDAPPAPDTPRFFFLGTYEIELDGVVICSSRDGFWNFETGDEALLLGSEVERPRLFFSVGHAFPVRDGLVIPQPYPGLLPQHLSVSVLSLR